LLQGYTWKPKKQNAYIVIKEFQDSLYIQKTINQVKKHRFKNSAPCGTLANLARDNLQLSNQ